MERLGERLGSGGHRVLDPVLAPSLPDGVGVIENITPLMSDAVSVPVTDRVDLCTSVRREGDIRHT